MQTTTRVGNAGGALKEIPSGRLGIMRYRPHQVAKRRGRGPANMVTLPSLNWSS